MELLKKQNLTAVCKGLHEHFSRYPYILSGYVYGSVMHKPFEEVNDIDILLISEDGEVANAIEIVRTLKETKLFFLEKPSDISVVFLSELQKLKHIYRPPTYFLAIQQQSTHFVGIDYLKHIQIEQSELIISLYDRSIDLAQSARSIFLNGKNSSFWEGKYARWLQNLVLEILFTLNISEYRYDAGCRTLMDLFSELRPLETLLEPAPDMKALYEVAETLRVFMQRFSEARL